MKIIAVDFDGCLCASAWPEIGAPRMAVINALLKEQAAGAKLILWTCRSGAQLDAAIRWCIEQGIIFDAVNDNLPENIERYGSNSRKVWATEYWDDKNVLVVNEGRVTTIAYPCTPGGAVVQAWTVKGTKFFRPPPWKPKKKTWWQKLWRCG